MRFITTLALVVCISFNVNANMHSPFFEGTSYKEPFIHKFVEINKETILVEIDSSFRTATFTIDYFVLSDSAKSDIPLIFWAHNYKSDFWVTVNDEELELKEIPIKYLDDNSEYYLNKGEPKNNVDSIYYWEYYNVSAYNHSNNLLYFEADFEEGKNIISVTYIAEAGVDLTDIVTKYSFRYDLFPAFYWKDFKNLRITLDARNVDAAITSTLGDATFGDSNSLMVWELPIITDGDFEIYCQPKLSKGAKLIVNAIDYSIAVILFGIILLALHLFLARKVKKGSIWIVVLGSFIVPIFICYFGAEQNAIMDYFIGVHASSYHGYSFLGWIILYPIIVFIYAIVALTIHIALNRLYVKRQTN